MKNAWIRFGCLLIGYNYGIVRHLSEVTAKAVKRYTSALMIVCMLWGFIGYFFTERYLHGRLWGSIAGSAAFIIIIIQIERQIILSVNPTRWLFVARGAIAVLMALLGAIIIDQLIFKEDIELEKITFIETRVKKALPAKTEELRAQLAALDNTILQKEKEREDLIADVAKRPNVDVYSTQQNVTYEKKTITDSLGRQSVIEKPVLVNTTTKSNVINPKNALIAPLGTSIENLRNEKSEKESLLLNIRPQLEKDLGAKVGFLDELKVMWNLITGSGIALLVWSIWFLFLMGLEMLILLSKINEKENDYEKTIKHQMELQKKRLDLLYANVSKDHI